MRCSDLKTKYRKGDLVACKVGDSVKHCVVFYVYHTCLFIQNLYVNIYAVLDGSSILWVNDIDIYNAKNCIK
jgi:hypothetical protein